MKQWIDGLASADGAGGTYFRSDLLLADRGLSAETVQLSFTKRGEVSPAARATVHLAAGEQKLLVDVVADLFALPGSAGHVSIESPGGGIVAWARTYNDRGSGLGTFGQSIPAFGPEDLIDPLVIFDGFSESGHDGFGFRTNLGILNVGTREAQVGVTLFGADGWIVASATWTVGAGQSVFHPKAIAELAGDREDVLPFTCGRLEVFPYVPHSVYAWASMVDNSSTDPTFLTPIALEALP